MFLLLCFRQPAFPAAAPVARIILGVLLSTKFGEKAKEMERAAWVRRGAPRRWAKLEAGEEMFAAPPRKGLC